MEEIPEDAELEAQLDWHYRTDAGLKRLQARLRQEARKPRVPAFVRRFASVAALLLVLFGLTSRLSSPDGEQPAIVPGVVALLEPEPGFPEHAVVKNLTRDNLAPPAVLQSRLAARTFMLNLAGRSPEEYRRELRAAGLPRGPRVDLALEVRNDSTQPLVLHVGGERTLLRFDLRGPGTLTLFGKGESPPFLEPRTVKLDPDASYYLPIPYLIGGRPDRLQGVYWTAPGRYTLAVHYRVGVEDEGRTRDLNVSTPPMTIEVKENQ
jgi:hypothetical protein